MAIIQSVQTRLGDCLGFIAAPSQHSGPPNSVPAQLDGGKQDVELVGSCVSHSSMQELWQKDVCEQCNT